MSVHLADLKALLLDRVAASARTWKHLKTTMLQRRAQSRFRQLNPAEQKLKQAKLMRLAALGFLVAVVGGMIGFFGLFAWYSRDLPKPGEIVRRDGFSTQIFDRNGKLLYDLFDTERRKPISIDQVPQTLRNAVVAIEDKDFYKHQGFDLLTVFRIPYNVVFRQRVVGGSTLTQQLVKNALLTNERSLSRKFKELVLAIQIERTFTKDQILEMYLNEAPYGGTAWGVGTASELYFNKPVNELNLVESAFLAGLPQRPSVYSPYFGKTDENGEPYWKMRTRGVLQSMHKEGYLNDQEFDQAMKDMENLIFEKAKMDIQAPHFVFYVRDQLEEMYGEELVEGGGLKVTTTLDLDLQNKAQDIVKEEIEKVKETHHITNGAAMVVNPKTGEIISMVGSRNYFDEEIDGNFNVATDGLRQPGSSIKPVTFLALLRRGYTPATMFVDAPTTFTPNGSAKPYEPKNYDGTFRGPVSLRDSLGNSLNIPAVKALAMVGVKDFLTQAYDMGFETLQPTDENLKRFGLAVTLGGAEVHLIDTVTAYSSFANGGLKVEPVSILKVEDREGHVLFEHKAVEGRRVFSEEEAFLISHILSDNNARSMAFGTNSLLNTGKPIAVKTGTTNDLKDNWTIGWSQEIMVGTWVGNNDNTSMKRVASGISGASPIWRRIILAALDSGYKAPEWKVPAGVEQVELDLVSGYPKHDEFPTKFEYVVKGTVPPSPDPVHQKMRLCKGENKLATEAKIAAGDYEEREFFILREEDPVSQDGVNRWQEGINAWINGHEDGRYKPPTEYCGESSDIAVKLNKPENEKKYDTEDIEIEVIAASDDGVEKIEIWVDGSLRETVNDREYKGKIRMAAGQHEIYARAKSRGGKEATSNTVKIGTGGQDWKKPEPTAIPQPTTPPIVIPTIVPIEVNPPVTLTPSPTPTTP